MEKTFENFLKLNNQKVVESVDFESTTNWLLTQIDSLAGFIRSNKTKDKFREYLKQINDFSIDNQSIDKKTLTKIRNDFNELCSYYYSNILNEVVSVPDEFNPERTYNSTKSKEELKDLIKLRGYKDRFHLKQDDSNTELIKLYDFMQLVHVYGLYDTGRVIKEYNKFKSIMNQDEVNWFNKYYQNLSIWYNLFQKMEQIENILKPNKEQKIKNEIKKVAISGKINDNLKDAVDKIAEDFRVIIEENEYKHYISITNTIVENNTKIIDSNNFWKLYKGNDFLKEIFKIKDGDFHLLPNYTDVLKTHAIKTSQEFILPFQLKMYNKLSGFLKEIGKDFNVSVYGKRKNSNEIIFEFKDGSSFWIKNSIVPKFSNRGTFFYTYPTTFHNAYLPNREKISNPNEYTVKKAFNDYQEKNK